MLRSRSCSHQPVASAQKKSRVITISEVTIVGRVQKPIAAVDVSPHPAEAHARRAQAAVRRSHREGDFARSVLSVPGSLLIALGAWASASRSFFCGAPRATASNASPAPAPSALVERARQAASRRSVRDAAALADSSSSSSATRRRARSPWPRSCRVAWRGSRWRPALHSPCSASRARRTVSDPRCSARLRPSALGQFHRPRSRIRPAGQRPRAESPERLEARA